MESRSALVTGASRGLGRVMARRLAQDGHKVAIGYHLQGEAAQQVVAEITAEGGEAMAVACDVRTPESVEAAFAAATEAHGPPLIVVANAGINRDGVSWKLGFDAWQEVLETNLTGAFLTMRQALPAMRAARWGRIIAMSSIVGEMGVPGTGAYAASKAGLLGLVRAVAAETANKGIAVNAITVGYMDEGMFHAMPENLQGQVVENIPMGRPGQPNELAGLVSFLCGDEGGYITGQALPLNGGMR